MFTLGGVCILGIGVAYLPCAEVEGECIVFCRVTCNVEIAIVGAYLGFIGESKNDDV
jgi:hypothetical protein